MNQKTMYGMLLVLMMTSMVILACQGCDHDTKALETAAAPGESQGAPCEYVPGNVIVTFANGITQGEADALIDSYGLTWEVHKGIDNLWGIVKVSVGEELQWIDRFKGNAIITLASPNCRIEPHSPVETQTLE